MLSLIKLKNLRVQQSEFLLLSLVIFLTGFTINHAYGQVPLIAVTFDQDEYFDDHSFILTVIDQSLDPATLPSTVSVTVTMGTTSCTYTLDLIDESLQKYGRTTTNPYITFSKDPNAICESSKFPVSTVGEIRAEYSSPTNVSDDDTATVISSEHNSFPSAMVPQPLWGKRVSNCSSPFNYGGDQDVDGICDNWEIPDSDGDPNTFQGLRIHYVLGTPQPSSTFWEYPCDPTGADPNKDPICPDKFKKDVYVEVDYMTGHNPDSIAIENIKNALLNAPTGIPAGCDLCEEGIRLHVQVDEDLVFHRDQITTPIEGNAFNTEFDTIRKAHFGTVDDRAIDAVYTSNNINYDQALTSKKQAFHYSLFIHSQTNDLLSSGRGEAPGDDFVVSLGRWTGSVGSTDQQEGTFMHELGHNLGLHHGGPLKSDGVSVPSSQYTTNCKPNYLSVMSYSRQFAELYPINRPLDYSRQVLDSLDESQITDQAMQESVPIGLLTVYGVSTNVVADGFMTAPVDGTTVVDWDGEGDTDTTSGLDINKLTKAFCDGTGTSMNGFDDWHNLMVASKNFNSWAGGIGVLLNEDTMEDEGASYYFYKGRGPYQNETRQWIEDYIKNNTSKFMKWGVKLSDEPTLDDVREVRISRILMLDYHIQTTSDASFNDAATEKPILSSDLKAVVDYLAQDDLYSATHGLMTADEHVNQFVINNPLDRDKLLTEINDDNIKLLNIASTVNKQPHGSTVELDQKVYTWTDKVYITIVAPDHNFDINLDDEIGNTPHAQITIATTIHNLTNYKLVETGDDTGIFTGTVILTGFTPYDANGDGNPSDTTGNTTGTGPIDGFIGSNNDDLLTVTFKDDISGDTVVTTSLIRWNTGETQWLEASYPSSGTGVVRVVDPDMNLDPDVVDTFEVDVWSDSDAGGIDLTVTETNEATGIFEGLVLFTTTDNSQNNRLRVAEGDTVTAEYDDNTLPSPYLPGDELEVTSTSFIGTIPANYTLSSSNPTIVDSLGHSLVTVEKDEQVWITAEVTNPQLTNQSFTFLVEVKDEDGVTVALSWITGSLYPGQTINPAQTWTATSAGNYDITIRLWREPSDPTELAPPLTLMATVP